MSEWGIVAITDNNGLLVSSGSPCYEYVGDANPTRVGNISTYQVYTAAPPLVFINCGVGNSAGILAIEAANGGWIITVLSTVGCTISIFSVVSGDVTTGYGMNIYGPAEQLLFSSVRKMLNVRAASPLYEGVQFISPLPVDSVSYVCAGVLPLKTLSYSWKTLDTYIVPELIWVTEMYQQCNYVTDYVMVCQDFLGAIICSVVPVSTFVCGYVPVTVAVMITTVIVITAYVERTDWVIYRSVANISSSNAVNFSWCLHKNGYYNKIINYDYIVNSASSGGSFGGYAPTLYYVTATESSVGELNKNNIFPYTEARANAVALMCMVNKRSDYVD